MWEMSMNIMWNNARPTKHCYESNRCYVIVTNVYKILNFKNTIVKRNPNGNKMET